VTSRVELKPRKVVAVVSKALAPLMRMLGLEVFVVGSSDEALRVVEELIGRGDIGVIVIQQRFSHAIKAVEAAKGELKVLTFILPDDVEELKRSGEEYVRDLARKYLGYSIQLS